MSTPTVTGFELDAFRCPTCKAPLALDGGDQLICGGDHRFPIRKGIPTLSLGAAAAEVDDHHEQLNRVAERDGWRQALSSVVGTDSSTTRYVTDSSRGVFLDLLSPLEGEPVLEVGASLGQITEQLARSSKHVFALEVNPGQALFAGLRCSQEGLENVTVVSGGDECVLPFKDEHFGCVVLNLVLEWCPGPGLDPVRFREKQNQFLRECFRVLKPGGEFFVATKNRFGITYLVGKHDEHVGHMRFGNALPRALMRWLQPRNADGSPQGLLYSYQELARVVDSLGGSEVRSYWAVPHPRYPAEYVPVDRASLRKARPGIRSDSSLPRSTRLLTWLPGALLRTVMPGLVFVVRK